MRRAEKASRIIEILDGLYPEVPVPLDHHDPFTLLVAVLLSAQTTDKKVNEITPALFAAAPTPEALAALEVPQIKEFIKQVGLANNKAKALKGLGSKLMAEHGGEVPASAESEMSSGSGWRRHARSAIAALMRETSSRTGSGELRELERAPWLRGSTLSPAERLHPRVWRS